MQLVCQDTQFSVHLPGRYLLFCLVNVGVGSNLMTLGGADMFSLDRSSPASIVHTDMQAL